MNTSGKYLLTGAVVLIAAAAVLFKYWDYVNNPWTRDGQVRAEIVQITTRVSAPIITIPVKDNQLVKAGDLLFELDPRTFEAILAQARAQHDKTVDNYLAQEKKVESAEAQVESAEAQVESAEAQIEVSRAEILQAKSVIKEFDAQIEKDKADFERHQELLPQRATSQKSLDRAKANYEVSVEKRNGALASLARAQAVLGQSEAALGQSEAALGQAEADLAEARANLGAPGTANASIREARAAVQQAELNLEFTQVRAPVDGYVTNLNLRLGSQAVANQPALALVDVNSFWVHGFFKETSIERIRKGDKAIVTLMTYPDTPIKGYVDSLGWGISQQDGSTGFELLPNVSPTFEWIRLAQRVPVRIHLTGVPEGIELRVGTTASVLVITDSSQSQKITQPAATPGTKK